MKLEDLLYRESEWLKGTGPKSNIVISSRVRLARNMDGFQFFNWAKQKEKEDAIASGYLLMETISIQHFIFVFLKTPYIFVALDKYYVAPLLPS